MEQVKTIKNRLLTGAITKVELAEKLGITRVTLDSRLERNNWKKSELHLLKTLV